VKVYSRRAARRLFGRFPDVRVSVHHFGFEHAGRLGLLLGHFLEAWQELFAPWIGWYVMIHARKAR
jgi:hypothetical protein